MVKENISLSLPLNQLQFIDLQCILRQFKLYYYGTLQSFVHKNPTKEINFDFHHLKKKKMAFSFLNN